MRTSGIIAAGAALAVIVGCGSSATNTSDAGGVVTPPLLPTSARPYTVAPSDDFPQDQPATDTPTTDAPTADSPSPDIHAQFSAWVNGGGLDLIDALGRDTAALHDAAQSTDVNSAVTVACTSLQSDTQKAQAYEPLPDVQAQSDWSNALTLMAATASDCLNGVAAQDAATITKAGDELNAATDALNATNADIERLK